MADTTHPPSSTLDYPAGGEHAGHHRSGRGATVLCIVLGVVIIALAVLLSKEAAVTNHTREALGQATAAADQMKSQLAGAQSQVTDLQAQVGTAKRQQTSLQSQLSKAQGRASDLQGQLTQAQNALQTAQQQSQSQIADLQAQVKQNGDTVSGLRRDLDQANGQVNDLKAQLAQAKTAAAPGTAASGAAGAAVELRDLPLKGQFSKGFLSSKYSLELKNSGADPVTVNIQSGSAAPQPATIKGGETYHLHGLAAGTQVMVTGDGFNPLTLTAR